MGDRQMQVRRLRRVDEELPVERNGLLVLAEADDRGRDRAFDNCRLPGSSFSSFSSSSRARRYLCRSSSTRA